MSMKFSEIIKFLIIRTIGNFLLLFMIFGFVATFGPVAYFEANYRLETYWGIKYKVVEAATTDEIKQFLSKNKNTTNNKKGESLKDFIKESSKSAEIDKNQSYFVTPNDPNEKILIPKSTNFSIIVPKIGINEVVFENVDPSNPDEYLKTLKKGTAHAKGSAFPGMNGTTYIFAHSTDNFWNVGRYNAVFFLLYKLDPGDDTVVFFHDKRYNYTVTEKKIVENSETQYLNANLGKGEKLILQTCWPPGTTWKRLLIIAEPKKVK